MTRQKKIEEAKSHIIRVHYFAGSYVADSGGKRTTCGSCAHDAAELLAQKLFGKSKFTLACLAEKFTFRATVIQEAV